MSDSLQARLISARKAAKLTQEYVADAIGIKQPTYSDLERGHSKSTTLLPQIADVLGVRPSWLATGRGPKFESNIQDADAPTDTNQITLSKDAIVIPLLDVAAAMGSGIDRPSGHIEVIEQLAVSKDWLRKNVSATNTNNLAIITAYGDSMEGTFNDGDLLLVDRGIADIKLDAVYVLALNDELFVKRLQRRPDGVLLMLSDNKNYAPYEIKNGDLSHFEVLGRVLMAWNVRRL